MEEKITRAIVGRYFEKLNDHLAVDVAIVGAGPSGLVAARDLARAGKKVSVFDRRLAPGGGTWGGGMLFNEIVVEAIALPVLADFGIHFRDSGGGCFTADSVEVASGLVFGAVQAGAVIFNTVSVQDLVFRAGRVGGVVINWSPVDKLEMHVDPLIVTARAVLDGTGHPSEISALAARKAGIRLATPTGGIMGEKPMWVEQGEMATVENTKCLCPGLYVSGMAANNVSGGFRMGPVFGGCSSAGGRWPG
jgi:thiamine thiazole synthase